jgi:RHS repeat-associated protein
LYYFNANHLGSGSLITDGQGNTYQTLAYAPHGEGLINVRYGSDYDEPYKFTGYQKDMESSLNYAQARYYADNLGIFISPDPMWYKYPSWTPYHYALNNPVRYTDPNGKWPTSPKWLGYDIHKKILKKAFKNELKSGEITKEQFKLMVQAGRDLDKKTQSPEESYKHSMTDGTTNQSVEEAKVKRDDFVNERIQDFQNIEGDQRFYKLGEAMHTVTDKDSPSHEFKPWEGTKGIGNLIKAIIHVVKETVIPGVTHKEAINRSVEKARELYEKAKNVQPQQQQQTTEQ